MKGTRRILCVALSLVIALSFLFAGRSEKGRVASTSSSKLKHYNIVWYWFDDAQRDTPAVVKTINNYLKEHTNLNTTVSFRELGFSDYNTKMPVIISSGQKFDLCFTASWNLTYSTYAAQGAFVNLTKTGLLKEYGSGITKVLSKTLIKGSSINGSLYALPTNKEAAYQWGLRLNAALVSKYHLNLAPVNAAKTPIAKLHAMTPLLKTIHEKEPSVVNNLIGNSTILGLSPYYGYYIAGIAGINAYKKNGKVDNVFATNYFSQYCNLMRSWYKQGYIMSDASTVTGIDNTKTIFFNYLSYTPYANWGATDGCTTFAPLQDPVIAGPVGTGAMTAISSTAADKARDMMFLNKLYTDKTLLNLVDYGIKGKDYNLDSHNRAKQITIGTSTTYRYCPQKWTQGNQLLSYVTTQEKTDKWKKYQAFNDSAILGQDIGFNFDTKNVTSQVSALSNVISQYEPSLITGSVDPNVYLPKFLSALKGAGANTVLSAVQKQFNAWKKAQK